MLSKSQEYTSRIPTQTESMKRLCWCLSSHSYSLPAASPSFCSLPPAPPHSNQRRTALINVTFLLWIPVLAYSAEGPLCSLELTLRKLCIGVQPQRAQQQGTNNSKAGKKDKTEIPLPACWSIGVNECEGDACLEPDRPATGSPMWVGLSCAWLLRNEQCVSPAFTGKCRVLIALRRTNSRGGRPHLVDGKCCQDTCRSRKLVKNNWQHWRH